MSFIRAKRLTLFSPEDVAGEVEVSESESINSFLVLMRPPGCRGKSDVGIRELLFLSCQY